MNLKDFLANRDKPPELYWSIVIEKGWVQAGIWHLGEGAAEVISVGPGAAWESDEEFIGAADAALSSSIQKLPEDYPEPTKTVFGVPSSWVKDGEITEEYLSKIKKICTELSLTPVGFVVLPEAIAHLAKSEEGAPLSAIILGLSAEFLEISVFKLGNLVGTTSVSRSVSITEDVTEGLSRFEGASPLPSRFVIFDGKGGELEEAKESLMQASWDEDHKIKFLHTPKVEILTPDRKVLATSLAGAAEIGNAESVVSKDVQAEEVLPKEEVENVSVSEDHATPEDLGFVVGEDVSSQPQKEEEKPAPVAPVAPPPAVAPVRPVLAVTSFAQKIKVDDYIQKTKSLFHGFSSKFFPKPNIPNGIGKKPLINLGIVSAVLLLIAGFFWWFYPKAEVRIYVTPKNFEQETQISFNTEGKFDSAGGVIPGEILSTEVSGDKTKATTGSKTIGDRAKGSVQIRNGTAFPINLTAGTTLVSSGNLKFDLDSTASVSAALSPSSPGTATVSVTASAIGAEYNLAKDEVFRVGNYPKAEVDATSTTDFSGGSSRQISAVDKTDQEDLLSQLTEELSENAKGDLSQKISENQIFVDDFALVEVSSENFDNKVGDEADTLKLSLDLEVAAVAADREKLLEYARGVLKDKIPSGFVLRDSQINFKFTFVDQEDENVNYKVTISANFLPEVNIDSIIKQIAGKTPEVTESYLSSVPGFSRAEVTLKPRLPGFLGTLPRVRKNITVEIVAER